ncbi:MAG: gamma-glutamyltransferase family protein [Pseudomonadota bacterium]
MGGNMVATSQPLAAQAGLQALADGGNAVDAALAAATVLTVVEPTGNGLGSDAFAIVWDGSQLHGLNASGRAPAAWTPQRFAGQASMPERGWESATIPGAVGAWAALSNRFGALPFDRLLAPAIRYAADGFPVSPVIATLWARGADLLGHHPGFADHFMPYGRAPLAGERFASPAMAHTLTRIAETKGEAFYRGDIAEKIAEDAARHGAAITVDDLAADAPDWCGTVHAGFDAIDLHEIPPNGQGIAACMALGMLAHTGIREMGPDDPAALHLQIEAIKLSLADAHAFVADLDHMIGVTPEDLLDPAYLAARAALIDPERAQDFGAGAPRAGGTVYLTTADASGMMVSYIQSNYSGFGSGVVVQGTGIALQNRGFGFTLQPGHPNQVAPRKRPFHTIIPGFAMKGGQPQMSFGVMGGPMQAQGHLQMVLRTQLWGQDVQSAVDAQRWRFNRGLEVAIETALPAPTQQTLSDLGHRLSPEAPDVAFGFGGAQLIQRLPQGGYSAGSDPRKDGQAVAF